MSSFYIIIDALIFLYACYSWYWQAKLELRGRFHVSLLICTIFLIWLNFTWNYIENDDPGINVFLALILLVSIVDGFTGFAAKKVVVSGYFKRTLSYSQIETVLLINVPLGKRPSVICILGTGKGRQYNLRFPGDAQKVISVLKKYINHTVKIEVKNIL